LNSRLYVVSSPILVRLRKPRRPFLILSNWLPLLPRIDSENFAMHVGGFYRRNSTDDRD
jgi:hypothetical protein